MINTKNAIGKMLSRGPKLNIDRYSKNASWKDRPSWCTSCGEEYKGAHNDMGFCPKCIRAHNKKRNDANAQALGQHFDDVFNKGE